MSSPATREEILNRLATILAGISGIATFARNQILLEDAELPAVVLLDGSEDVVSKVVEMKTRWMPPVHVRMQPQIYVAIKKRDNTSNTTVNGVYDPIGAEINHWRDMIRAAIEGDETLLDMLTTEGQIFYRGMITDMQDGQPVQGQAVIKLDLHYVLMPAA